MTTAWVVVIAAATTSVLVVGAALGPLTRHGVIDVPASRSLHAVPTPRGGGLGVLAAVLLVVPTTVLISGLAVERPHRWLFGALAAIGGLGVLGLLDDLRTLSVRSRLVTQLVVSVAWALGAIAVTGSSWVWAPVLAVAVVGLVNITNFMDGANGLISMHAMVASGWYLLVGLQQDQPGVVLLAVATLGGAVGFLPFNAPVARVFLGDVGSYTFGAVWAVLSSWLFVTGTSAVVAVAPLLVLLTDTLVTMGRRVLLGERPTDSHRMHVYQRLVTAGWSHTRVTVVVAATALTTCILAIPVLIEPLLILEAACLGAMLLVSGAYLSLATRVEARGSQTAPPKPARR